jgi:hypothetical protein
MWSQFADSWASLGICSTILIVLACVYTFVLGEDPEAPVEYNIPICEPGWVGLGEWADADEEDDKANSGLGHYNNVSS